MLILRATLNQWAKNIVKAMNETGVKRIIAISSRRIYDSPLRSVLIPYKKLGDVIESSDLDYTKLKPTRFTNVNGVDYEISIEKSERKAPLISRKSIAAFI